MKIQYDIVYDFTICHIKIYLNLSRQLSKLKFIQGIRTATYDIMRSYYAVVDYEDESR